MTQYIADEAHFKEVIERVSKVKQYLWIGTADIKDLYVGERPFLGVLAELVSKGRDVRLIHAKSPIDLIARLIPPAAVESRGLACGRIP